MAESSASNDIRDNRFRDRVRRRWYVALLGAAVVLLLGVAAMILVSPSYAATGDVLVAPPPTTGPNGTPNPYLGLGDAQPFADVLARSMADAGTLDRLRKSGLTGTYTVLRDVNSDGPILVVSVTGKTAAGTQNNLRLVLATARPTLTAIQDSQSIPARAQATAQIIAQDTKASVVRKTQIRAIVVAVVLGFAIMTVMITFLDSWLLRRSTKRKTSAATEASDADAVRDDVQWSGRVLAFRNPMARPHRDKEPAHSDDIPSVDIPSVSQNETEVLLNEPQASQTEPDVLQSDPAAVGNEPDVLPDQSETLEDEPQVLEGLTPSGVRNGSNRVPPGNASDLRAPPPTGSDMRRAAIRAIARSRVPVRHDSGLQAQRNGRLPLSSK
jgi:hypothetical protein